jgi:mannose-6-phosphate isomerase-like protein (cupin superfamily)
VNLERLAAERLRDLLRALVGLGADRSDLGGAPHRRQSCLLRRSKGGAMTEEAKLVERFGGLSPDGPGWFVVNLRDAAWFRNESFGTSALFQPPEIMPHLGINIGVLEPGKANCLYHRESNQEAFLVLSGECILIVEGEERRLRAWDFFHSPPGTAHVFVGAGDEPCTILFIGARLPDEDLMYEVDDVAAKYGASVEEATPDPAVAYAKFASYEPAARPPGPWDD